MRLPPIPPDALPPDARSLHDDMASALAASRADFVSSRGDGALIGPFPPMLHAPQFGAPLWAWTKALIEHATLPDSVREVAILVVGAAFNARYALYSHERGAQAVGLPPDVVATIAAGERPTDLGEAEAAAFDLARVLVRGHTPADTVWARAVRLFGESGTLELAHLVAVYCAGSVLLNAVDAPVPGRDDIER